MTAYVRFEISKEEDPKKKGTRLQILVWQKFYYGKKRTEKASDIDIRRGTECPLIYNVILVSDVQPSDSVVIHVCLYIYPFSDNFSL